MSLMGTDEAAALAATAQKLISSLSKVRSAEDKVVKAMPTWTESEADESERDARSNTSLVNCHHFTN